MIDPAITMTVTQARPRTFDEGLMTVPFAAGHGTYGLQN